MASHGGVGAEATRCQHEGSLGPRGFRVGHSGRRRNVLLFEWRNKLSITGKMHLLAALINLGQLEQANQLFDELDVEAIVAQTQAAKVGTWIETKTLALSMLLEHMIDLRPSDQRMLLVVQAVRKARTNGWWGTTLDTVAATSALIKWMGIQSPCDFTGW